MSSDAADLGANDYSTGNNDPVAVQDDNAPIESSDNVRSGGSLGKEADLEGDNLDGISKDNVVEGRTRGIKKPYREPGDDEGFETAE